MLLNLIIANALSNEPIGLEFHPDETFIFLHEKRTKLVKSFIKNNLPIARTLPLKEWILTGRPVGSKTCQRP